MDIKNNIVLLQRKANDKRCRSKTQPAEKIMEAYAGGQRLFGENKVQEMVGKYEALPKDINLAHDWPFANQ